MQNFKELIVWQKAHKNVLLIYNQTKTFPKEELYGITSQLRRAAVSIPTNIAEGSGKSTKKDFANYLQTSLGSSQEVEYLILLCLDLNFISTKVYNELSNLNDEVKAMLISLIKKVRS